MWRVVALCCMALPAAAESLVAARTIRARDVVTFEDVALVSAALPGALREARDAVGLEARVTIYAGRPVRPADLGPPALVERNQTVTLAYRAGGLSIIAEGRALTRAGAGEAVRVMNLASKTIVTGRLAEDGTVLVGPQEFP